MAYDLNLAVIFGCSSGGALSRERQRTVLSIVDGMVSGEGNGPLQPLPVNSGVLIGATNPFLVDLVMARLMGFDYHKIPLLANHRRFADATMADFDPEQIVIAVAECTYSGISSLPPLRSYVPPPGWREHIEIARTEVA
jgi:hypothetical protein